MLLNDVFRGMLLSENLGIWQKPPADLCNDTKSPRLAHLMMLSSPSERALDSCVASR